MPPRDEISSTEKLLEHIRRGPETPAASPLAPHPPEPRLETPPAPSLWRRIPLKKPDIVGVDLGYTEVRLVRARPNAAGGREIVDCRCVPFEAGLDRASPLFPRFLRSLLTEFCQGPQAVELWSAVSSAHLDIRYLRIPQVARRQVANAVYWAFRKKNPFDEGQVTFDFELLGPFQEDGATQLEAMGYALPSAEVEDLRALFARSGFPLTGITSYPFLLQNLLRRIWREAKTGHTCALYIGRNWSRIDMFVGANLVLSRGIKTGMSSMLAEIKNHLRAAAPAASGARLVEMGADPAAGIPEELEGVSDYVAGDILAALFPGHRPASVKARRLNLGEADVFQMALPALERLVRQVERTVGHFAALFGGSTFDRLCVAGQIAASPRVVAYLSEQLGIPLEACDPFQGARAQGPEDPFEREAYLPAAGLALSGNRHTPNFIFTYRDEIRRQREVRTSRGIMALSALLVAVFLVVGSVQSRILERRHQEVVRLQQELNAIVPLVNRDLVLMLAARAKNAARQLQRYGERYQGVALVGELSRLTPPEIRLVDLRAEFPLAAAQGEEAPRRRLIIDGVVAGERAQLEPSLAGFMVRLKSSPLLTRPRIVSKAFEMRGGREVLTFSAELDLT